MLRWCDFLIRAAAPVVPHDLRADWMREWRAELAYACARAGKSGRRPPLRCVRRTFGVFFHAAWLRWDRWRIEMIWQDLKHALRALRRKPGFTVVTVLTLAIGIGGNAAIFGAVNAVLLRPLPYLEPDRLVQAFKTPLRQPDRLSGSVTPPDFSDWRRDSTSFTELSALVENSYPLTGSGAAEQVPGAAVTGGFFPVIGVAPLLGRTILPDDDAAGGRDVVVLSHALWKRRFGEDRSLLGRQVGIDGVSREVIGVMPPGFAYPLQSEMWVPLRFTQRDLETQRGAHYIDVVGRLRTGVSIDAARAELKSIAARLGEAYPDTNRDYTASLHPLRESLVGSVRPSLFVLMGAVGLVLLIVCVNVAGLVLVRALGRGRELAVRVALGAGRAGLVRGLLVESLVLGLAGGAAGLVLAYWATSAMAALDPSVGVPLIDQTRLDATVVTFTLAVSVAASVLFGVMPAWQATSFGNVGQRVRADGGTATADRVRQRLRSGLIVAETVLAVVLLVGAGLLTRSFARLLAVELGFVTSNVQTFTLTLPATRYAEPHQRADFLQTLVAGIKRHPDVEAAGAVFGLPLTNFGYTISTSTRDGVPLDNDEQMRLSVQVRVVTPDYFNTLRIPVTRGRAFTDADRNGAPLVAVVNEAAAARIWPGENALGHQLEIGTRLSQGGPRAGGSIVGVVRDVRERGPARPAAPTLFLAHAQFPMSFVSIAVRTRGEPAALIEPMRRTLEQLDRDVPMFRVRSMDQLAASVIAQPRFNTILIGAFAGTALLLSALGLYGVLAYAVGQRTREIGIRLALGAKRGEVLRMVMSQAGRLVVTGVALGLIAAVLASRVLRAQLFEVAPTDVATYVLVAIGLLMVSLLASWIPARRASRINPMAALRKE